MNRIHATVLASFGLAACATPGPEQTHPGGDAGAAQRAGKPVAAEAVIVENNVPAEAIESGLVDEDTLVCRREMIVGSHIPKMVCLSAKERERIREASQGYMNKTKRAPEPRNTEG